ncbi:MAG: glyceraldehyde-3-phosphate dehydrogenase, partial [Symbiobacteriaceae bacterium]|nr:glyceraldehyde-3-phosphate dehydrogenase [Symbiobacteriaceae bacterium]
MIRIAINGFGRIGRLAARQILGDETVKLVAINDLADIKTNAHLFKYDSSYGVWPGSVVIEGDKLIVDGYEIQCYSERDPAKLPWKDLEVDLVVECTGVFTSKERASLHLEAGAKKVVISAPATNEDITIVLGVNEGDYDPANHHIISNASCTTNCLAPVAKVLQDNYEIVKGTMTTVHAYPNAPNILDQAPRDLRRA